jgi:hypothetical protein
MNPFSASGISIFLETNLAAGLLRHEIAIGAPGAAEKER